MERLTHCQLTVFSEVVLMLQRAASSSDIIGSLFGAMRKVALADAFIVNTMVDETMRMAAFSTPEIPSWASVDVFNAHLNDHPTLAVITDHSKSATNVGRWSDFTTNRQFRETALHQEYFRKVGVNYQLALACQLPHGRELGIVFDRSGLDFSDQERSLLTLLGPHFREAFLQAQTASRIQRSLALHERAANDEALMVVEHDYGISFVTAKAEKLCRDYFGEAAPQAVPAAIRQWLADRASSDSMSAVAGARKLTIERCSAAPEFEEEIFSSGSRGQRWMLRLTERATMMHPGLLTRLKLTTREAEILCWMAQGKRNSEIATILGIGARTVDTHVMNILAKLGVETRTGAVALAWEAVLDT